MECLLITLKSQENSHVKIISAAIAVAHLSSSIADFDDVESLLFSLSLFSSDQYFWLISFGKRGRGGVYQI